jgi:8-oxo-dGTP pyrophosphatase MutT (NUDIX family)
MAKKSQPAKGTAAGAKSKSPIETRREFSAGGLIWRRRNGAIEVVMVRPAGKDSWTLPKGHVEEGERVIDAALREVREETGLSVSDPEKLGDISYIFSWRDKPGGPLARVFKRVSYFLMRPRGGDTSAHDFEIEEAVWLPIDEAIRRASYKNERQLLQKARATLSSR